MLKVPAAGFAVSMIWTAGAGSSGESRTNAPAPMPLLDRGPVRASSYSALGSLPLGVGRAPGASARPR